MLVFRSTARTIEIYLIKFPQAPTEEFGAESLILWTVASEIAESISENVSSTLIFMVSFNTYKI